jgi:hypothetical protein
MADAGANIDSLTPAQQEALQQYTAVTDQDVPAAIALLERCQWNVQVCYCESLYIASLKLSLALDRHHPIL